MDGVKGPSSIPPPPPPPMPGVGASRRPRQPIPRKPQEEKKEEKREERPTTSSGDLWSELRDKIINRRSGIEEEPRGIVPKKKQDPEEWSQEETI